MGGGRGARGHMLMTSQPSWACMPVVVTRGVTRPDVAQLLMGAIPYVCKKVTGTNTDPVRGGFLLVHPADIHACTHTAERTLKRLGETHILPLYCGSLACITVVSIRGFVCLLVQFYDLSNLDLLDHNMLELMGS